MKPIVIIVSSLAGLGFLALLASEDRKPGSSGRLGVFNPASGRLGVFNPAARSGNLEAVAALPPGLSYTDYLDTDFNSWLWASQQNTWAQRRALLGTPKDKNDPKYNELYYSGPWVLVYAPEKLSMSEGGVSLSGKDVVSRNWYGSNPKSEGGGLDALGLIGMVGNYTLPFIPGFGTAANVALQGAVALGRGESLDNALIAAARGALPPYAQVAFDMAVGVYMGKQVDQAALDAGLDYLESKYPGSKQAYKDGLKIAKDAGL